MTIHFANVNVGSTAGDGTGDPLRVAFNKINLNFANVAVGQLDAGNVAYTMGHPSYWNYAVTTVAQALDQVITQSNAAQTALYLTTFSGNVSAGNLKVSGTIKGSGTIQSGAYTIGSLPSATVGVGTRAVVTDANCTVLTVGTLLSNISGGAGNVLPVYSDGTNWRIG